MSSFNNISAKPDPVPDEVYDKAKKLIVPVLQYIGRAKTADAVADERLFKNRFRGFSTYIVDGKPIKARSALVCTGRSDLEKVNIVTVNERQYRCEQIVAIVVLLNETDAILVKHSFDTYEAVDGTDEFDANDEYKEISTFDVQNIVKPFDNK